MPKKKLKEKLYTIDDFKAAKGLEKIYMYLMQPSDFELSYLEEERLEDLRMVWGIMARKMNQKSRIDTILRETAIPRSKAYLMMDEAAWLFGDVLKINSEIDLGIIKERYFRLAERAEKDGNYDDARKCLDSAREVIEKLEKLNPEEARPFAGVIFSNNPKLLTENTEDAEFEEIPDGILELEAIRVPTSATEG